jgi:hypothetical protein
MGKSFLEKPVGELLKALAALPVFLLLAACNHWGGLAPVEMTGWPRRRR